LLYIIYYIILLRLGNSKITFEINFNFAFLLGEKESGCFLNGGK